MDKGWKESNVTVEASYSFTPSDHAAMETRAVIAEIRSDVQNIREIESAIKSVLVEKE